ncbi:MAG: EamA family transporter [Dermatophilaceae bacterium]
MTTTDTGRVVRAVLRQPGPGSGPQVRVPAPPGQSPGRGRRPWAGLRRGGRRREVGPRRDVGLLAALASCLAFGSSGPFAKSLLATGWSPGAVVLARVGLAGLVLLGPAAYALRGRWGTLRRNVGLLAAYGMVAVAGCQLAFFAAVSRLPVGVALLVEYLGVVLVVGWVWLRTRRAPGRVTGLGVALAIAGLALVIDVSGAGSPDLLGLGWAGLAAVGLAMYFVISARAGTALPAVALAAAGMLVGAAALGAAAAVGVLPLRFATAPVEVAGAVVPWWVPVAELSLVAAAAAYLLGTVGARRLGSTVASFVGLTEVLFAVLLAWLLLGESPRPVQVVGGVLVLAGVAAVRAGQRPA